MKNTVVLTLFFAFFFLSGCVYHQAFEQGNVLTTTKLQAIHRGMSAQAVEAKLGSPVLKNVYVDNRMTYVYTQNPKRNMMIVRRLVIDFDNNKVTNIRTDL